MTRFVSGDKVRIKGMRTHGVVCGSTPDKAHVGFNLNTDRIPVFMDLDHDTLEEYDALCDLVEVTILDPNSKALPIGTIFMQRCETEPSSIPVRADLCVVSGGVATFPNSPLNTLIAAARTLCDNVETVGTHNRVDAEHLDKLRQALDGI